MLILLLLFNTLLLGLYLPLLNRGKWWFRLLLGFTTVVIGILNLAMILDIIMKLLK